MSLEETKCLGSPRTSQIPRSGSRQCSIAISTCRHERRPHAVGKAVARLGVQEDRVEHHPPHVVLALVVGAVADPHRARALVAGQVVERPLGNVALAPDAVHDLQRLLALGDVGHEVEEVVRLPVEAERVQPPEHEARVADPAVAVIPVALAAGRLGQRRRGRRDEGAGGRVGQALERQRRALQVAPPRMVGELALGQPLVPVVGREHQPPVGLVEGLGWSRAGSRTARRRRSPGSSASCAPAPAHPRSRVAGRSSGAVAGRSPRPVATASP